MKSQLTVLFLIFGLIASAQTVISFSPLSFNRTEHPKSLDYYEIPSSSTTVSEFSPGLAIHNFFKPNWNWYIHSSLVGFSYNRYYQGQPQQVPFDYEISYSRLDLATLVGVEYWTTRPQENKTCLRLALAAGIWGRLVQTHKNLLNDGHPGMNARVGLNFPIKQNFLGLFFNYGFRVNNGFYMQHYGLALSYDFRMAEK